MTQSRQLKSELFHTACAKTTRPPKGGLSLRQSFCRLEKVGAGEGARTLDPDLGKVVLYH
jgi:hypothetical protein